MKKLLFTLALTITGMVSYAQGLTLYNMDFVPQSMRSNPAQIQQSNFHFSVLPILPNINMSYINNGFVISDILDGKSNPDTTILTPDKMLGAIGDKNFISTKINLDFLSFGFKVKEKHYFSFNVSERIDFTFDYTKNFMTLLTQGTAAEDFIGKELSIAGTGFRLNHLREYAAGYSQQVNENLSVGGRFKLLQGMAHLSNAGTDISLKTDDDLMGITATSTIDVRMAGLPFLTDSTVNFDPASYATNFGNIGFAVDVGGKYKVNEKWSTTLNINDLGFVRWKTDAKRYFNNKAQFKWEGLDLNELLDGDSDYAQNLSDSLADIFGLDNQEVSFINPLTADIYLGGEYKVTNDFIAAAILNAKVFKGGIHPSVTLSGQTNLGKWVQLIGSYSIVNRSYTNVGLGAALNAGPIQIYSVSDNVLGWTQMDYAKNLNVQFGMNVLIGYKPKTTKEQREAARRKRRLSKQDSDGDGTNDYKDKCPDKEGFLNGCPDKDGDGVADNEDVCPDVIGDPALFGCPDSDGDNVADKDDKCPEEYGTLNGCLDTDGDSIPDYEDPCPTLAGSNAGGCPDTDGDGVEDSKDVCPEKPGKPENGGCPDTDGDGVFDNDDRCPDVKGSPEFLGCTDKDSDRDTTPDVFDDCPYRSGPKDNKGCPK